MIRKSLYAIGGVVALLLILLTATITQIDRTPYTELDFSIAMQKRLDSLKSNLKIDSVSQLEIGWSIRSITPSGMEPLAGYGNREPKLMAGIHDSIYVRTIVLNSGNSTKTAMVFADLLIFHPVLTQRIKEKLPSGWNMNEIYLSTTHSHSSVGGWAPGLVGDFFSGSFNDSIVDAISTTVIQSILRASDATTPGTLNLLETELSSLVYNRLVGADGIIDPWLKTLILRKEGGTGIVNFFSAHATCLGHHNRQLSGDFPSILNQKNQTDSLYDFSAYGAGAVASMGPKSTLKGWEKAEELANEIYLQNQLYHNLTLPPQPVRFMRSFRLSLPLRDPQVKISENWALRPYLFHRLMGNFPAEIAVLQLGSTVLIGLPCDFSGELAMPLYDYARSLGLNLIISSFNGSYIGYVIKDEWYDLPKYEARAMSWYGPDTGTYISVTIRQLLQILT